MNGCSASVLAAAGGLGKARPARSLRAARALRAAAGPGTRAAAAAAPLGRDSAGPPGVQAAAQSWCAGASLPRGGGSSELYGGRADPLARAARGPGLLAAPDSESPTRDLGRDF